MKYNNPFDGDTTETYSPEEKAKLMDYYGTAMQYFPVAQVDLINLEQKFKNDINNSNDINIYGFKVRTRRKRK